RDYQRQAIDQSLAGESGVVVLPCGAGKTIVGVATMSRVQTTTLILVTNSVSAKQWKDEILARTTLTEDEVGEYSGDRKSTRLNSSHVSISYAVFCLKKKKIDVDQP